jgi:hypothetical protein
MNNLTKALLGSAAITVLAAAPAVAAHPAFSVTAMHDGKMVNKTKMHNQKAGHITYTFGVSTAIPFSQYYQNKQPLGSFYKWNSYSTVCSNPKSRLKVDPKKTDYGKASVGFETYSLGCPSGPTKLYGVFYKITDPDAAGHTDHVHGSLSGKFKNSRGRYRGTLNIDYTLSIDN